MRPAKNLLSSTLSSLQAAEARVQQLRTKALSERASLLQDLHVRFGFSSRQELVESLAALEGGGRRTARAPSTSSPSAKRKRARITPEMRKGIVEAIRAGMPGAAIGKRFGVSGQSVQNIKKAAGLVRKRAQ